MKQKNRDLPVEILIKKLMDEVNNLENQFTAQEKKLFNSKESIKNLFENPDIEFFELGHIEANRVGGRKIQPIV